MRITSIFYKFIYPTYKVHDIPYRYRGKNRKIVKPTIEHIVLFKKDLEREERNMLILRHPYLTKAQSNGHMKECRKEKYNNLRDIWMEQRNKSFNKNVTIEDRLNHLRVSEAWE